MLKLNQLTAHELMDRLRIKDIEIQDIYKAVLAQIRQYDPLLKAYLRLNDPQTNFTPLQGEGHYPLPIAIKDNMCIKGEETTCASQILKGFFSPYDATVIHKLKQAGALIMGHTNMDEFAFGSSTENSAYGVTRNPWDPACVPGGSSGGSAAAVAAGEAIWALGSDTGGSIRQPAALCGVVGVKPTYGRVSRYGLIAFASSLDQIGPITRDVTDAAILLGLIAGHDPLDSTSADCPVPDYTKALTGDIKGLKIGIPRECFVEGLDPQVKAAVFAAIEVLKNQGAEFLDVSLPHTEYSVATYYIIATAEASSNLARYDGVRYGLRRLPGQTRKTSIVDMFEETRAHGFGPEVKRRVMLGTYALSSGYYDAYYLRGQKVRTLIKRDFDQVFKECHALITPTSPTTAFRIGARSDDPLAMYLCDIYTISANLSGVPAISIPCGFSKNGLPIGLQIITKPFDEETMFRLAHAYEQKTDWHKKRPILKETVTS
jgi:aspartyl-tRNA(Asn)/glutamyl-tRNA(Gln) amidotransferase subunit A